jgi:hypothetical protein
MSPLRSEALVVGGIALAIVAVLWWAKNQVVAGVGVTATALNPNNPDNLVNSAVNGVVQSATGNSNQTLVGWIDDVFGINQGLAPGETLNAAGQIVAAVSRSDVTAYNTAQPSRSLQRMLPDGLVVN